ncbi:multidrug resistance-associated protein 4, partial [Biomphalaria glabrata]
CLAHPWHCSSGRYCQPLCVHPDCSSCHLFCPGQEVLLADIQEHQTFGRN